MSLLMARTGTKMYSQLKLKDTYTLNFILAIYMQTI